jgi:hypothetical protein
VVEGDDEVAVSCAGGDFCARQGNVNGWILPLPRQKFNDAKGAASQLYTPILAQQTNQVGLWHAGDEKIDVFTRMPQQDVAYSPSYRIHTRSALLERVYKR